MRSHWLFFSGGIGKRLGKMRLADILSQERMMMDCALCMDPDFRQQQSISSFMSFHQSYELHRFEPGETYFGETLDPSWQVSIYQSCMGDHLEECNFKVFLERLGGESDTVKVHRVGFSGDGWYEFVAIHDSNTAAVEKAAEMLDRIKNYPILDEDRFAQAEEDYYTSIGYVQDDSGEWLPAESA